MARLSMVVKACWCFLKEGLVWETCFPMSVYKSTVEPLSTVLCCPWHENHVHVCLSHMFEGHMKVHTVR